MWELWFQSSAFLFMLMLNHINQAGGLCCVKSLQSSSSFHLRLRLRTIFTRLALATSVHSSFFILCSHCSLHICITVPASLFKFIQFWCFFCLPNKTISFLKIERWSCLIHPSMCHSVCMALMILSLQWVFQFQYYVTEWLTKLSTIYPDVTRYIQFQKS